MRADVLALRQPEQIGRMIVAQHPGRRRLDRRLQALRATAPRKSARVGRSTVDADARQVPVEQQLGLDQERVHVVGRQAIVEVAARPAAPPAARWRVQRRQEIDRGLVARARSAPADRRWTMRSSPRSSMMSEAVRRDRRAGSPAPRGCGRAARRRARRTARCPRRDARWRCRACRRAPAGRRRGAANSSGSSVWSSSVRRS